MHREPAPQDVRSGVEVRKSSLTLGEGESAIELFHTTVPDESPLTRVQFERKSLRENRYPTSRHSPLDPPDSVRAPSTLVGVRIGEAFLSLNAHVRRREANLPYGYAMREL